MFNFPYLTSLLKKNQHCRKLFTRTAQWENTGKRKVYHHLHSDNVQGAEEEEDGNGKSGDEQEKFALHWKKAVKLKFEVEEEEEVAALMQADNMPEKEVEMEWLKTWELESILRPKPEANNATGNVTGAGLPETGRIQCKICDEAFETRRQLSQHKRLEHFPSWEGGNKEFCYLPYFVEPKRFNLLRGTLSSGQLECGLCQTWLRGGVKQKVGPYLERLRMRVKEETAAERNEQNEVVSVSTSVGKKRGRRSKSMSRRVCELCSKILSNRKGLERHMLIHTGEKPFPCDLCGKPFRRKDNCVRHKKTAHLFRKPRKPRRRKIIPSSSNRDATVALVSPRVDPDI